jgi:hypothetical protein
MRLIFASVQAGHGDEGAKTGLDLFCSLVNTPVNTAQGMLARQLKFVPVSVVIGAVGSLSLLSIYAIHSLCSPRSCRS